jgi:menaquinone-dependent protoporphyrinogen oxidase
MGNVYKFVIFLYERKESKLMAKRIIVAYDSVYGSTAEIAEHIGKELSKEGNVVDVHRLGEVREITDYQAVILGSPIIIEKATEETSLFLQKFHTELSERPLALFIVCLAVSRGSSARERVILNCVDPLLKDYGKIKPLSIGVFAGVLDFNKYVGTVKESMQNINKQLGMPTEGRHDYRNWDAISKWAKEVNEQLL